MPNIANLLKEEIRRLARKEVKVQVATNRRAASQHRREIAQLKRLLRLQARKIARLELGASKPVSEAESDDGIPESSRYSARSVRSQRRRLGLSAEQFGKLLGVTALTVYNWEKERARPRRAQFASLVSIRGIGRREAFKRLEESGSPE